MDYDSDQCITEGGQLDCNRLIGLEKSAAWNENNFEKVLYWVIAIVIGIELTQN